MSWCRRVGPVQALQPSTWRHPTVSHAEKKSPFAKYSNQQMTEAPDAGLFFFWGWHLALLLGRRYNRAKKAQGGTGANQHVAQTGQIVQSASTAKKLARGKA